MRKEKSRGPPDKKRRGSLIERTGRKEKDEK